MGRRAQKKRRELVDPSKTITGNRTLKDLTAQTVVGRRIAQPRPPDGDVIKGSVGEGARGVVIGKNVVQIGTLAVPAVPLILLILVISGAWAYQRLRPTGPTVMTGEFNVAVAQFGQVGRDGRVQESEDSRRLSQWFFERLQDEYESLSSDLSVLIWHDSMDLGTGIGIVPGSNPAEQSGAASDLAARIDADIVIYGNLDSGEAPAKFTPEFYVVELLDAEELVGRHAFGSPIDVELPIDRLASRFQFNQTLTARATALTVFTLGLAWEFAGNPEMALELFRQAEQVEDWPANEGKEIVYLFIGRELGILDQWNESQAAFQIALDINPAYDRALFGMGNVYREIAQALPPAERLDTDDLIRSIEKYKQALDAAREKPGGPVVIKARIGLGSAYRLQGEAYLFAGDYSQADEWFELSIQELQRATLMAGEDDERLQASAYQWLGTAYEQQAFVRYTQGDTAGEQALLQQAISAYTQCIEYSDAQPQDWFLANLKAEYCLPYMTGAEESLEDIGGIIDAKESLKEG